MIIDISQEVLSCRVYPGDPSPVAESVLRIANGDVCNLSKLSMCLHNGTHVDAPFHFVNEGKTIGQCGLEPFVGDCFVARDEGDITAEKAVEIVSRARQAGADKRILIAGEVTVTEQAAEVFAKEKLLLLGNESQTVGPVEAPMKVHLILLGSDMVLLEGIVLDGVDEGKYFLNAAPLNIEGCDGSPCRAYLIR